MPAPRSAAVVLAALVALAVPAEARPALADSTDAMEWARAVVHARRAVEQAEAALDPDRQATLAAGALDAARALATGPRAAALVRPLVVRAQAVYEAHHAPVTPLALSPREVAAVRGEALAELARPDYSPDLEDPAAVAARRAAAAEAARVQAAEDARAAGPDWLFYPAEAAPLVDRQRRLARGLAGMRHRMRRHFPRIERTLRRRGLPTDLKLVAVIESRLDPDAESWAGARGMWQFMPATAAQYGLDSLSVADPVASTDAAARYLRWLGRRFDGDWQLALAAYNCGVGRVERLVRAHRAETGEDPTFWDLHDQLPRETQAYVPRFIAVAEALGARG